MGRRLAFLAGILCLASNVWAQGADEETRFQSGRNAYLGRDYKEAKARFDAMTNPKSEQLLHSPSRYADALMYRAATDLALGLSEEADNSFKELLINAARRGESYEPDPLAFPTSVLDAFRNAQTKYRAEIRAEKERRAKEEQERKEREEKEKERQKRYLAALEAQAGEQLVTTKRSRVLAFVPFGVGQFQNNQPILGWGFLGLEAAMVGGAIISGAFYVSNLQQRNAALRAGTGMFPNYCTEPLVQPCYSDALVAEYHNRATVAGWVNIAFVLGFVATAVTGIVQANLAFTPETKTVKPRPLPQVTWGPGFVLGTF